MARRQKQSQVTSLTRYQHDVTTWCHRVTPDWHLSVAQVTLQMVLILSGANRFETNINWQTQENDIYTYLYNIVAMPVNPHKMVALVDLPPLRNKKIARCPPYLCRSEEKWKRCLIATVNFPASTLSAFKPGPFFGASKKKTSIKTT